MSITRHMLQTPYNRTVKKRTKQDIKFIVMHYVGALGGAEDNAKYYAGGKRKASADFYVGHAGEVWQGNDYYNYYSWHCGGGRQSTHGGRFFGQCTNENSIGIELCVRKKNTKNQYATDSDWWFEDATITSAVALVQELMTELNVDIDHVIRHYDVNGKYCPNPMLDEIHPGEWTKFKMRVKNGSLRAADLQGMTTSQIIEAVGPLASADMKRTGIPAAITMAQFILESGWGQSELARRGNNIFGMKKRLSGNTWPGSTWDKKSTVIIRTEEQTSNGRSYYIKAAFRAYPDIASSIADHSAYLAGARNGTKLRYAGLVGCADSTQAAQIIKTGGYATDVNYVKKLTDIIKKYKLERFNVVKEEPKNINFQVRVTSDVLRIRTGAGTQYNAVGYTGRGVFTITEEKDGWGRLKSGAGWIYLKLNCVQKL